MVPEVFVNEPPIRVALKVPPEDDTDAFKPPLDTVPPASVKLLIVYPKYPLRLRLPPLLTVVAELALKAFTDPSAAINVALLFTVVVPV